MNNLEAPGGSFLSNVEAVGTGISDDVPDAILDVPTLGSASQRPEAPSDDSLQTNQAHESSIQGARLRFELQSSLEPVSVPDSVDARHHVDSFIQGNSNGSDPVLASPIPNIESAYHQRNSPCGAILDESVHNDEENVRVCCSKEIDGFYTFLLRMNVRALRGLLKDMKLKHSGKKEVLLARLMISADIQVGEGETLMHLMAFHRATSRFISWRQHQISLDEKVPQYWVVAPAVSRSLSLLGSSEAESFKKKKKTIMLSRQGSNAAANGNNSHADREVQRANVTATAQTPCFSISELARLCIIIRDDEDAKAALLPTGQEGAH